MGYYQVLLTPVLVGYLWAVYIALGSLVLSLYNCFFHNFKQCIIETIGNSLFCYSYSAHLFYKKEESETYIHSIIQVKLVLN